MELTEQQILESLASRVLASRWGIGVASNYIKSFVGCSEKNGLCPVTALSLNPEQWQKELQDAAQRLTFCDEDYETKGYSDGTGIMAGAVLEYDAVCSSRRKDRDGDVLDTKGLELDLKMPLLWQHLQLSPIGKHLTLLSQDETTWSSKFAIADTELGRDAATLTKFGALRKSIGFKPLDLSPIEIVKGADGKEYAKGWHVKKANVFEASLVSIPSNADAGVLRTYEKEFTGLCTAFSRNELHNGMVKHWAKSFYDQRPVIVPGATLKSEVIEEKQGCSCGGKEAASSATKTMDVALVCKSHGEEFAVDTKGMSPYPKESYEYLQWALSRKASEYMRKKGDSESYYCDIYATFKDHVVLCCYGDRERECYQVGYEVKDGSVSFTGEPVEVDVEPKVLTKFLEGLQAKSAKEPEVKLVEKELSLDELSRQLVAKALLAGQEGVVCLQRAKDALDTVRFAREVAFVGV